MDKAFEIQKQARNNATTLHSYLADLQNWESEMKRKEAALNGQFEQELPPVRSKRKEPPVQVKKKTEKRIAASDYGSWEKFDVDKACEEVDMEGIGPTSLDSKKSQKDKLQKLKIEAQNEKEKGNRYVKQEKWDEAIKCYNRAIELVKDDAIYYANRGLCYLKKESLHQAEQDCTEALRLDPTYVKAFQRRAAARELLGSLRAATQDLNEVLRLEPHNAATRKQLEIIKSRMGTKGSKSKSSPTSTPTSESKMITKSVEPPPLKASPEDKWKEGVDENITVITPVKKPPHLRSKRALKHVPILEIPLGSTTPEKPATRLKIVDIEDTLAQGDTNNNDANNPKPTEPRNESTEHDIKSTELSPKATEVCPKATELNTKVKELSPVATGLSPKATEPNIPESNHLVKETSPKITDVTDVSPIAETKNMMPPVNSVQFMTEWKQLKGNVDARIYYLSIIDPAKIPSIFENALESDVLSEIIIILHQNRTKMQVTAYLKALSRVKRFSALAMFLTSGDKKLLNEILSRCIAEEKCSESDVTDLKTRYELE